jgi:hypothetical protein
MTEDIQCFPFLLPKDTFPKAPDSALLTVRRKVILMQR